MIAKSWFYDLIVYLYALSVLLYFADFLNKNIRANRIAFRLLTLVWVSQTTFFVYQLFYKSYFPVLTQFETLFFFSWLLVSLSLIINYIFRIDFFIFFSNLIGFGLMVFSLFSSHHLNPELDNLTSHLMMIHVTLALLSYATFLVAGVFSIMFLLQNRLLKEKKWTSLLRRLPSIGQLEEYSYLLISLGVPLLLLSLILGLIWAYLVLPYPFWFDPKVLFSFFVLIIYSIFLYGKVVSGWYGKRLAWWSLLASITVIINYLVVQDVSMFHRWF